MSRIIDIKNIKNPSFVKDLSLSEMNSLVDLLREEILIQTSRHGGHLSSNLGAIEATVALCKIFDFNHDKLLFDVGHQSYAYKILTGRSLDTLRQKGGISGFQKIDESSYDVFDAGHSSTTLSVASGMAFVRDENNEEDEIIVFIGDAAFDNGISFEGLRYLGKNNNKVIIVLNDNTDINGEGVFNESFFKSLNIDYIGLVDGHDISALTKAFEAAKKNERTVLVHLRTSKGHGYHLSENDYKNVWHGVSAFDIESGEAKNKSLIYTFQDAVLESLDSSLEEDNKRILICPATMIGSNIYSLADNHPAQFKDVGINEEHALLYGSGLSLMGYRPIVSIYSTFLQRAYDEIIHDFSRNNLGLTLLIDRAGLVGADGETHQGIYDESLLYNMPNTIIACPSHPRQIKQLIDMSYNLPGVFAIRYPKDKGIEDKHYYPLNGFKANKIKNSKSYKSAIVSVGAKSFELIEALNKLELDVSVYNPVFVKPIDMEMVDELIKYENVIIYNPYSIESGFAIEMYKLLKEKNKNINVFIKTIPLKHIAQASVKEQEDECHLNVDDVIDIINK